MDCAAVIRQRGLMTSLASRASRTPTVRAGGSSGRSYQFFKVYNTEPDGGYLEEDATFIWGMQVTFTIRRPSLLYAMGHCNIRHRRRVPLATMWGLRLGLRGPPHSLPGLAGNPPAPSWIPGAKTAGNFWSPDDGIVAGHLKGAMVLSASGKYRVEFWGSSEASAGFRHRDGYPNGVAEVLGTTDPSDPSNQLIVVVSDYPSAADLIEETMDTEGDDEAHG
jgi:hypothetical protein